MEGITVPVIRYGLNPSCEVCADQETFTFEGLSCRISTPQGALMVQSKLIGSYNLYNILAAVSAGIAMDLPLQIIQGGGGGGRRGFGKIRESGESERDSRHRRLCPYPRCAGARSSWE